MGFRVDAEGVFTARQGDVFLGCEGVDAVDGDGGLRLRRQFVAEIVELTLRHHRRRDAAVFNLGQVLGGFLSLLAQVLQGLPARQQTTERPGHGDQQQRQSGQARNAEALQVFVDDQSRDSHRQSPKSPTG